MLSQNSKFNDKNIKKEKESIFEKISQYFIDSAIFMLIFITMVLVFTNILFIFKISISNINLIGSFIISLLIFIIWKRKNVKGCIISILISIFVFILATVCIGKIYDGTADGNTYHKLAVGAMKNGWNPVYESVGKFNKKDGNPFDIYKDNVNIKWVDHYAKGTETFAAVIYKSTGNIECGKVYNILWIYIGFILLFSILKQFKLSNKKSLLLAFILAFNPISLVQITNYYLDGVLTISLFLIILIGFSNDENRNLENYLVLGCSLIWCINTKFNGLAFCGVFCLALYLYQNIRNYIVNKNKFKYYITKNTVFYIVIVLISVLIVGSGSYTRNFVKYGNPLYPLYGKNHIPSMINKEIPKSMQKYSPLKTFMVSIFAMGENVSPSYSSVINEPDIKIPLTISKQEIDNYGVPDIRMGGFGPLFSAIFVLTIIGMIYMFYDLIKKKDYDKIIPFSLILIISLLLISLVEGSYWARYIPYFYLIPIFVIIYYFQNTNKVINIILSFALCLFIANSILIGFSQYKACKGSQEYVTIRMDRFKNNYSEKGNVKINLSHHGIQGVLYNVDDMKITKYTLVDYNLKNDGYMFTY